MNYFNEDPSNEIPTFAPEVANIVELTMVGTSDDLRSEIMAQFGLSGEELETAVRFWRMGYFYALRKVL